MKGSPQTAHAAPAPEPDEGEAFHALLLLAEGHTGGIPPELLVRHVLSVTALAGWPVQRAALEAVLRRLGAATRDGLVVSAAPRKGLGVFSTRRKGSHERPYRTAVARIVPLQASCDCRDFVRNSLGLCKHVLTVLAERLGSRRKRGVARGPEATERLPRMAWDPIRPLTGPGDWMERVRLVEGRAGSGKDGRADRALRALFRRGSDGTLTLATCHDGAPDRRLALVERLLDFTGRRRELSVDPALVALLQHESERHSPVVRGRLDSPAVRRALSTLRRRLYPYQRDGVHRFFASGRLVLADDMGLGKTAQAIAAAHVLYHSRRVERGLLIVPASLKDQWLREWRLFSDAPLAAVDGGPAERAATYRGTRRGFLVTNYEQVLRDLQVIQRFKPDFVVLDEAQRIKNWATKTAAYVKTLAPPFRLVLTGTPMENRLEELASILDWVDDLALEPKWRLAPFHSEFADGRREIVGAHHLDTLRARLSGCLLRRGRSEVASQLPSRTDTVVPVAITEAQTSAHAELDMPIAQLLSRARRRPLTPGEFLRLMSLLTTQRIIANGMAQLRFEETWPSLSTLRPDEATLRELASPKLSHLREILAQIVVSQGRKAVVFSQWRRMLTLAHWAAKDVLGGAGLSAAFFTGQEKAKRRTQNIVDFHDDPKVAVLFATDAGGVGLNLQRAASCCVNLDLPWNPAVLEQRIGRIYRLGQKNPIDVYSLVTESSIEARIAGLVADKKAFFSGLFDGDTNEVRFERGSSFLARLERLVEPAGAPAAGADEASPEELGDAEREVDRLVAEAEEGGVAPVVEELTASLAASDATGPKEGRHVPPLATDLGGWLSHLRVRRRDDGGLAIEAAPEAAEGLATLFEGLGRLLREASAARRSNE